MSESDEHGADPQTPSEAQAPPVVDTPTVQEPSSTAQPPLPATMATSGWPGPIGKPRGVLFVILISLITFGIYHLYWVFKVFDEMKQHTRNGIGGVIGLVIALVIGPVIWFVMPSEIGNMYAGDGRAKPITGWTGLWVLLPFVGWFVWMVKVQRALNRYWESKGAPAA